MSHPTPSVLQVPIDRLVPLYSSLAAVLNDAGLTGNELNEVFSKHVRAECIQCGIQITGDEIGYIAMAGTATAGLNPKQTRLRQGYCARNSCDSRYYNVHFGDHPKVDWPKIKEKAGILETEAQAAAEDEASERDRAIRKKRLLRLGAGAAVIVILLVCRHYYYYGYVPVLQRPEKFRLHPASVNQAGPR